MTYPECEKLAKVAPLSQKIGEFVEWLLCEKGITFGRFHDHDDDCYQDGSRIAVCGYARDGIELVNLPIESFLAEFFDVDLKVVEKERRAMLAKLRKDAK